MANLILPSDGPSELARLIFVRVKERVDNIYASINLAAKNAFIHGFAETLHKYNLSLEDYGKIRAAIFYGWSENPDLTAQEITEIFGEDDPREMDTAELETAVLAYANLTVKDWLSILNADARYHLTATYIPTRSSIQAWTAAHYASADE